MTSHDSMYRDGLYCPHCFKTYRVMWDEAVDVIRKAFGYA